MGLFFDRLAPLLDLLLGATPPVGDGLDSVEGVPPAGLSASYGRTNGTILRLVARPPTAMPETEPQPQVEVTEMTIAQALEQIRADTANGERTMQVG